MTIVHDNLRLRVFCMRLFGLVLIAFAAVVIVSTSSPVSASTPASHEIESAAADDGCEDECPGERPDGQCDDNCQHCGCCGAVAFSLLPSTFAVSAAPVPSGVDSPPLSSLVPTDVARGIFKPPRHTSV